MNELLHRKKRLENTVLLITLLFLGLMLAVFAIHPEDSAGSCLVN